MAKRKTSRKSSRNISARRAIQQRCKPQGRTGMGLAVTALIVNLIIPGLGSIIGGRVKEGVWQLILLIVGALLSYYYVGIPLMLASWIWGLISGATMINRAE